MYPSKAELEKKWWHRLVKVIIIFLSISASLFGIICAWYFFYLGRNTNLILSFENEFNQIKGIQYSFEEIEHMEGPWLKYQLVDKVASFQNTEHPLKLSDNKNKELEALLTKTLPDEQNWVVVKFLSKEANPKWMVKKTYEYSWFWLFFLFSGPVIFLFLWVLYYKVVLYVFYGKRESISG